jgi:SAM-dependent methyltransferase
MNAAISSSIQRYTRGRLIDIDCGEKPYVNMMKPYVAEHVGVDHQDTLHDKSNIDRVGTVYDIPAKDGEFDSALCTAVMEHLEEPDRAIAECHRVLRIGGIAIYTVPLFWHLHEEPRDFYRYTKYGIRYLFEKNGFEIVELKPLSGFWITFGQLFVYYIYRFRKGGKLNPLWWLIPPIGLVLQGIVYILDYLDKAEQWTWMYLVVARKK